MRIILLWGLNLEKNKHCYPSLELSQGGENKEIVPKLQ